MDAPGSSAVRALFENPAAILRAVIAAEILAPPVALRGEVDPPGAQPSN